MKILLTGDTHLGFDFPRRGEAAPHRRGEDFFRNFEAVIEHARAEKADLFLHGGDMFDRSEEPPSVVERAFSALHDLASSGVHVGIIAGNHERSALPPSLFMQHARMHIFHSAHAHVFHVGGEAVSVTGVPFIRDDVAANLPRVVQALERKPGSTRVLMMHQAFEGAEVGPSSFRFRAGPDVVSLSSLPRDFDVYVTGHIHRHQMLARPGATPVIHPGSTERTSFAEREEQKGFVMLDVDGPRWTHRFIPLPSRPMLEIHAESAAHVDHVREILVEKTRSMDARTIIRLHVSERVWAACSRRALSPALLPSMPLVMRPPGNRRRDDVGES